MLGKYPVTAYFRFRRNSIQKLPTSEEEFKQLAILPLLPFTENAKEKVGDQRENKNFLWQQDQSGSRAKGNRISPVEAIMDWKRFQPLQVSEDFTYF
ncbi:hypothetical protein CDAR_487701 [Caerostris darwini]|uniref:Uncharacterized protein n=1 Tax=Caerostris darwini TaxID=1538125 RepID=A0AAV4PWV6_9ARAC|nr:hypothetical protein CDAR_487701 [Caerostris darwini]